MKKKYVPRIVAELHTKEEKKIYQSFRLRCMMKKKSVREMVLTLIKAYVGG